MALWKCATGFASAFSGTSQTTAASTPISPAMRYVPKGQQGHSTIARKGQLVQMTDLVKMPHRLPVQHSLLLAVIRWNVNPPRHWQSQWHPADGTRSVPATLTRNCARTFHESIWGGVLRASGVFGANLTWRIQVN